MDPTNTTPLPKLITAHDLVYQTGLPLSRVYELSRTGDLPSIRLGRAIRFYPNAVREFLAGGGTASNEPATGRSGDGQ